MPNNLSAKKRLRQTEKRTALNKTKRSAMRTYEKKVLAAVEEGDKQEAQTMLVQAYKSLDKAARHGILHANTAANRKRRLSRKVNEIK